MQQYKTLHRTHSAHDKNGTEDRKTKTASRAPCPGTSHLEHVALGEAIAGCQYRF